MVMPSLYSYIQFRQKIDPEYDAMCWADMAECLFVEMVNDGASTAEMMEKTRQFTRNYPTLTRVDWDDMICNVQNWHDEYFRRLDDQYNKKNKTKVVKNAEGRTIYRGCIQGIGLQDALFTYIQMVWMSM